LSEERPRVTKLLELIKLGDSAASEQQLIELVYNELHQMAARHMGKERPGHVLQTTALVNEVYMRLFGSAKPLNLNDSAHFFAVAARQMRLVLVDQARSTTAKKRKGIKIPIDEAYHIAEGRDGELVALDDALKQLEEVDEIASQVVELRFFGGYTAEETAQIMGRSVTKVNRDWDYARSWLHTELDETAPDRI